MSQTLLAKVCAALAIGCLVITCAGCAEPSTRIQNADEHLSERTADFRRSDIDIQTPTATRFIGPNATPPEPTVTPTSVHEVRTATRPTPPFTPPPKTPVEFYRARAGDELCFDANIASVEYVWYQVALGYVEDIDRWQVITLEDTTRRDDKSAHWVATSDSGEQITYKTRRDLTSLKSMGYEQVLVGSEDIGDGTSTIRITAVKNSDGSLQMLSICDVLADQAARKFLIEATNKTNLFEILGYEGSNAKVSSAHRDKMVEAVKAHIEVTERNMSTNPYNAAMSETPPQIVFIKVPSEWQDSHSQLCLVDREINSCAVLTSDPRTNPYPFLTTPDSTNIVVSLESGASKVTLFEISETLSASDIIVIQTQGSLEITDVMAAKSGISYRIDKQN